MDAADIPPQPAYEMGHDLTFVPSHHNPGSRTALHHKGAYIAFLCQPISSCDNTIIRTITQVSRTSGFFLLAPLLGPRAYVAEKKLKGLRFA